MAKESTGADFFLTLLRRWRRGAGESGADRRGREFKRFDTQVRVAVPTFSLPETVEAFVEDASAGGISLRLAIPPDTLPGDVLTFGLGGTLSAPKLKLVGTIVRIDWVKKSTKGREASIGIRFDNAPAEALEALAELVRIGTVK